MGDLYRRLTGIARERVRSGEISERGLAKRCELSQPHLHNVLKNIRTLSPSSADRLMRALNIQAPELVWRRSGDIEPEIHAVPLLRGRVGPGTEMEFADYPGYYPLSATLLDRLIEPVLARLGPDLVLPRAFDQNDLVLLDQNPALRIAPDGKSCWVVRGESGFRVRYVRLHAGAIFLANEATLDKPERWQLLPPGEEKMLETVRARIVWMSREMET